ncbi:hypothetical protein BDR03DRAFT_1012813 [Suillus americanus]|nr:hypothetical protein BDR03DRAFT_1012813 [Suillus americanus]
MLQKEGLTFLCQVYEGKTNSYSSSLEEISKEEYASYFWEGIYKGLRAKIEGRLLAKDPDKDLSKAFAVDKVISMAEKLLHRDRFDADLLISEDETDSSASESEDTSSTESESTTSSTEDSETEEEVKPRKSKKKSQKKHSSLKDTPKHKESRSGTSTPKDTSKKTKCSKDATTLEPQDEIESLIKQLNSMSLDDPQYALLYYRVTRLDPRVMKIVSPPPQRNSTGAPSITSVPRNAGRTINGQSNRNSTPPGTRFYTPPGCTPQDRICFGCGEKGHVVPYCPRLAKLQAEGKIRRSEKGQIQRTDGTPIRRLPEESIVEAIMREEKSSPVTTHFISVASEKINTSSNVGNFMAKPRIYEITDTNESSDEDDLEAYMIPGIEDTEDEDYYVYPVERNIKTSTKARREHFDGVFPPPLKRACNEESGPKGKENVPGNKPYTAPKEEKS